MDLFDNYKKEGYILIQKFFQEKQLARIKNEIVKVFRTYSNSTKEFDEMLYDLFKKDLNGYIGCCHAAQNLLSLNELGCSTKLKNIIKSIGIQFPIINTRPILHFSSRYTSTKKHYWKVPQHQDWQSTQGSINGITCWLPLIPIRDEYGFLKVAPKSHLNGALDYEEIDIPITKRKFKFKEIKMNLGDLLIFSNFLVHKSGNNKSKKIRLTASFRFDDIKEKTFIERKYPRHKIEVRQKGEQIKGFPSALIVKNYFNSAQPMPDAP